MTMKDDQALEQPKRFRIHSHMAVQLPRCLNKKKEKSSLTTDDYEALESKHFRIYSRMASQLAVILKATGAHK